MGAAAPDVPEPSFADVDREWIRRLGLYAFVEASWPTIEPVPFVGGWHIEEICKHLEAVSRGELQRLIINVPPGASKSTIASVLWPAWDWIVRPTRRWMVATFDDDLAWRDALRCRGLVRSPWYAERWGERVAIDVSADTQETQSVWSTTAGGRRVSVTVGGKATGWHADVQLIDDPVKPKDALAAPDLAREAMERTWRWWTATMASRRAGPDFARVIIMQRLSDTDLVARILESDRERQWTHLMLPMRYEPERACMTRWGGDRRTQAGALLCPDRFDERAVAELEREMGSQVAAAQLQQRPAPAGGNIFQRSWFVERWRALPTDLLYCISADCTFKDSTGADFVSLQVWGYGRGKFYLVDRIHDRMGLPETVRCMQALAARWPKARAKLIEDKANGPAVEQMLRDRMPGIIMVTPEGGKVARANAVAPLAEAGSILLPDDGAVKWSVDEVLEELVTFPFARHDDDVDAATQALTYMHDHSGGRYLEAMRRVAAGEVKI